MIYAHVGEEIDDAPVRTLQRRFFTPLLDTLPPVVALVGLAVTRLLLRVETSRRGRCLPRPITAAAFCEELKHYQTWKNDCAVAADCSIFADSKIQFLI